jgi:hypothetical protein
VLILPCPVCGKISGFCCAKTEFAAKRKKTAVKNIFNCLISASP